jgi:tetratricopeptide (TPR) repeat protein
VLGAGPGVVVLDNFETPWAADPLPVEELLRMLGAVPGAAVAVSSRGTGRPAGLRWRDFAMLSPLPMADARRLFLTVAGPGFAADSRLDELLAGLDGVPLAVELMGYAAQGQPLDQVAQRWRQERTGMLARMGGARRELSVAVSVEASITAPLMTGPARRLLSLLGVLPDGTGRDDLTALLPEAGLAAAAVLRQLGLAFDEGSRLRTLAPVREHVAAAHPPEPADLARAVGHYAQLAATTGNQVGTGEGETAIARLQADTGNIAVMLEQAAADGQAGDLADGIRGLAEYWRFTGFAQPALVKIAEPAIEAHGTTFQQAQTWRALGDIALDRSDHDGARARYEQALPLYQQVGDVLGEANCIQSLGDIALARSDHDAARARYEQAQPLYQQAGSVLGEANCIKGLGDIALERSDHDAARARYEQALPLYQQVGSVLGEANCIQSLGDIALDRSDHDAARTRYEQALPLYQQVGAVLGEANCIQSLGDIALGRSDHDAARARYEQALPLYQRVGAVLGEANCIQGLGNIALERSDHDAARARYEQALPLYQAIKEPYSVGWALVHLARLDPAGSERARRWRAACEAWTSIGREDLIESVTAEFE